MRSMLSATAAVIGNADKNGLITADLVLFMVGGVAYPFWSEHDTATLTVNNPWTGSSQSYEFVGGGTILDVGETPRTSDLSIRRKSLTMSAIHPSVLDMWTGHDMRLAQVAVFHALFDPTTRNFIEALLEFVGELNGAPKEVPAVGGEGGIRFDLVSDSRQLTRINPAKRSDAHQRTRDGDTFHQDIGVAGTWVIPFGQESA